MSRRHSLTSRKPTLYLIAEDRTGELVFKEIVRKKRLNVIVVPFGAASGVSTLAKEVEDLIKIAMRKRQNGDCIIVLHDTDISVQRHRESYDTIARICKKYKSAVTRLEAVQEIEAWLLADDAFCAWMGEKPKASDHIPQPSKRVESLINAKFNRRLWTERDKPKILADHFSVTGDQHGRSLSMKAAMDTFLQLSCTQPETT